MSGLRTRKPTGEVAWPLILVEGGEKHGKSCTAFGFAADERVGRTFVFELGEAKADEYARLGPYEIVQHNGTFSDILAQLEAACAEPRVEGRPNVVVFDQITSLWELIKDWTEHRARNSKAGRALLVEDPDAEVDIPMNLWNDAKARWYKVINLLRRSDVIGVLVARASEVAKVSGGRPVSGQTEYRVEAEKSTVFAVTAQVRVGPDHRATLVAVNSLDAQVPPKGLKLPDEQPLGHLVFEVLGCTTTTGPQRITHGSVEISRGEAMRRLLGYLTTQVPDPQAAARAVWDADEKASADEFGPDDLVRILDAAGEYVEKHAQATAKVTAAVSALANLDERTAGAVQAWMFQQGMPEDPKQLGEHQADDVLAHLATFTAEVA